MEIIDILQFIQKTSVHSNLSFEGLTALMASRINASVSAKMENCRNAKII